MKSKQIHSNGERRWVLVFETEDEVMSELQRFARDENLKASSFSAIGAFQRAVLGYFDWDTKDYKKNHIDEQVEVLALTGFITESDEGPKVHAHVSLGRSDGIGLGGHLLEASVRPTLELVITESPHELRRKEDPETGLPLIDLTATP